MGELVVPPGKTVLFSDEDAELVSKYDWYAEEQHGTWYCRAKGTVNGKRKVGLHNLLMPDGLADHANTDGLDNRRENLRYATPAQNNMNRKGWGRSQYKGVSWFEKSGKWMGYIYEDRKKKHLGYFAEEVEAARAYDAAAKTLFGEFARLNFPEETDA